MRLTTSPLALASSGLLAVLPFVVSVPPASAAGYTVQISCKVPKSDLWRQLSPKSCMNLISDHDQTFTAKVKDSNGHPVAGVTVTFTDSDSVDAHFRMANQVCTTGSTGTCSDELVDSHPRHDEVIYATASITGSSDTGSLVFK